MLILLYHGVRPNGDTESPDIRSKHVSEKVFAKQLGLLQRIYKIIPLSEAVTYLKEGRPLPQNSCAITFDDGYANNAETAAPILKARGIPATFFVTTDFIDGALQLWVDRFELAFSTLSGKKVDPLADAKERDRFKKLPAGERETAVQELERRAGTATITAPLHRAMSWNQVRELSRQGFEIGAHTKTHPILSRCTPERIHEELLGSKEAIERELGIPCKHFAYPNGQPSDWNQDVLQEVHSTFTSCCTTVSRFATQQTDPYAIPRITVDTGKDIPKFILTITGIRSMLRRISR